MDITIRDIYKEAAATTKEKGFDVTQHTIQLCLILTEIAEALKETEDEDEFYEWRDKIQTLADDIEDTREDTDVLKHGLSDPTKITNMPQYLEELADIQIRLASYVGGNGWTEDFIEALKAKMKKNKERPHKHGKAF